MVNGTQVIDNLTLVPLTQTEVSSLNLQSLGVITFTGSGGGGGSGDMSKSVFATINPSAGFVDKAVTANQVPYSGLTALPGGTVLFLRADGSFATPPGQTYNVVSIGAAGLVPVLPPSSGFNFYFRGDGQWVATSTLSIAYSQLTGLPSTFTATAHANTHITTGPGQDIIPPATSTKPGLVPAVPSSVALAQVSFLRGDNTWTPIPGVTGSASGLIPQFPGTAGAFFNASGTYSIPSYALLSGVPSTFDPIPHAIRHVSAGQDLIPNFAIAGTAPGLAPASPGGSSLFLCANGTWSAPTGAGGLASPSAAGLMNQLPAAPGTTFYWGGDNNPHLISSLSLTYAQITGVPIFAGSSAGLVPTSAGGTSNYLRADGVYSAPTGSVVTTLSIGAVAALPASSGANFYLNGVNVWTALSSITISYSQITSGVPSTFNPSPHAASHITPGGADPIGPATVIHNGLVPILPSSNPTLQFLRGDSTFAAIPIATGTSAGLVPQPTNSQTQWFRADATFQTIPNASTTQPGHVPAIPNNANVFLNGLLGYTSVDYTNAVSGKPSVFPPQGHNTSHVTGGGDQIQVFSSSATGLVPIAGAAGTYLGSNGLWTAPAGAGDVLHTFIVGTSGSLQGGGPLTGTSITLSLIGDVTTPSAGSFYGTNSSGTRGWFQQTTQTVAILGIPGLVPAPPGASGGIVFFSGSATYITPPLFSGLNPGYVPPIPAGGAGDFLRTDGWVPLPLPGLAATGTAGLVPSLLAVGSQPVSFLRGDNTWQLINGLSIAYTQITGVPVFSGTTTNGLVPGATAGSASTFLRGDGVFFSPPLSSSAVPGYIAGLPSASGFNFWARGDNSWQLLPNYVVVQSPWSMPAIGVSTTAPGVLVNSTSSLLSGMTVFTGVPGSPGTQCFMEVASITDLTHVILTNRGYAINPALGTTITGGLMEIVGPGVANSGIAGFVPTPTGLSTQFLNGQGQWAIPPGAGGISSVTTQFSVTGTGIVSDPIQLKNDVAVPGAFKFYSTDALGNLGWFPLISSWETNAPFSMPGIGAIQTITLLTNAEVTVGTNLAIEDNSIPSNQAFLEVVSVNGDGIHIVVKNNGYAFNSPGGAPFATNAAVTLAGPGVAAAGRPGFVPSSNNDTVSFLRADGTFQVPAIVQVGLPGYVPAATGDPTVFLNGNGAYSTPAIGNLATTGSPGAVQGLPATNQSTSVLRGDNTWVLMSTLSPQIVYGSIPGIPTSLTPTAHHLTHISTGSDPIDLFSTTTTTSGLVPGSNNVGATFFLNATGSWSTPPSGPGLATSGNSGLVPSLIASPSLQYLNGTNAWLPIAGLSINYTQLTGSVPFAAVTHGSTHLDSAGGGTDPIPVVAGVRTGLVPILPAAAPTTKFLRGDATWTVIPNFATNSVTPGLVVGSNSVGTANFLRADNSWQPIPPLAIGVAGLAPALPGVNNTSLWLRGDATWTSLPFYWTITASFIQPAINANVTVTFITTTALKANMVIATVDAGNVTNIYSVASIVDGNHASLQNLGCPGNTAAASTVNTGQANQSGPPVMTGTSAGIVPIPHNLSTEFLCGNGSWAVPPTTGVPTARNVSTQYSLTGGGSLATDLTLNLVNDTATPAGFSVYGTDTSSNRGWYASSSFPLATTSNAGLLLTLTGSTSNFLRADGSWAAPSGLAPASTGVSGIVQGLPASNQTTQWLRADNSWQFLPDSNVTTASFVMPAIGATVFPVTFSSTGNWDAGMTLFFATGNGATCCYMEVTAVNDAVSLTIANRGYQTNPVAGTTIPTCLVFVVSPGTAKVVSGTGYAGLMPPPSNISTQFLNGVASYITPPNVSAVAPGYAPASGGGTTNFLRADATWAAPPGSGSAGASTVTAGAMTWPAVGGSTASVLVGSTALMIVGSSVYVPAFGTLEVTVITDGTHATFRNNGNVGNATSGAVTIGTALYVNGTGAKATATASGMIPVPPNDNTKVLLGDATFGQLTYASLGGTQPAPVAHAPSHVTGGSDVIGPATSSVSGLVPVLSTTNPTNKWLRGDSSWASSPALTIATVAFTWPAAGGTVLVTVDSTSLIRQNMALYATGLGVCEVTAVNSGTTMTIRNNNNTGNAGSTASQSPAFYVGGSGALATSTSAGVISPDNTATHFLSGNASFVTPPRVSASADGYVPTAPGSATQFLNGLTGTWTTPPTATATTAGYVSPPNNTYQFLRGDATWTNGGYLTTFSGFTVPAINTTVVVTVATGSDIVLSQTHVLTDGTLTMIGRVTNISGLSITYTNQAGGGAVTGSMGAGRVYVASAIQAISNTVTQFLNGTGNFTTPGNVSTSQQGYAPIAPGLADRFLNGLTGSWTLPPAATSTVTGYVPTPPNDALKFLNGQAAFTYPTFSTTTNGTFTIPAVGVPLAIVINAATWMKVGLTLYISDMGTHFGFFEVTVVTDSTHITIQNQGYNGNAASGIVMATGAIIQLQSAGLSTATQAGLVPTPPNNTYQYLRGDSAWVTVPLSTVTTASFTQVAIGSNTASIAVESSGWMSVGMVLIVGTGSTWNWMSVVSKADTTHCVLTNIQGTTVSGTIASGAQIFESAIPIATATNAGIVPIPPNNTYQFLNGQSAWVTPCVTYGRFKPYDNIPFSTTYPAFNTRGSYGLPVLDCPDAVTTDCLFSDIMPANANLGSGLTVVIKWTAHTATTGAVRWQVAFGRLNGSIASATFDTAGLVTSTTSGTIDTIATATVTGLTTINGITSGDLYVVKVSRLGADAADTMTDTAQLCSVEVRSAGT